MAEGFYRQPILNSPYEYPGRHWELDPDGQPTDKIRESRRHSSLVTPVPLPKKRKASKGQGQLALDTAEDPSASEQKYNPNPIINDIRGFVDSLA